jgi:tRNA threonylcarbamoyladenosine modification (KEOPS) complex Cgi121 subunit
MAPVPDPAQRTLQAVGARRKSPGVPTPAELVARLRSASGAAEELVALFDARSIAGERHLLSAWAHLGRSRTRGESRLRVRGAEFALWVAGDDQLPRALAKVGLADDSEAFVVVAEKPRVLTEILELFGLVPDPSAYPKAPDAITLERLGIGAEERASVPESAWEGIVLERVAMLELSPAKAGPASTPKH